MTNPTIFIGAVKQAERHARACELQGIQSQASWSMWLPSDLKRATLRDDIREDARAHCFRKFPDLFRNHTPAY